MDERGRVLGSVRELQGELALTLTRQLLTPNFSSEVRERLLGILGESSLPHEAFDPPPTPGDQEAWRHAVEAEVERSVFVALVTYVTWLSDRLRLRLEGEPGLQELPLPGLTDAALDEMEKGYGADSRPVLSAVYNALLHYHGPLPPLGAVADGKLRVDEDALHAWWRSQGPTARLRVVVSPRSERHGELAQLHSRTRKG